MHSKKCSVSISKNMSSRLHLFISNNVWCLLFFGILLRPVLSFGQNSPDFVNVKDFGASGDGVSDDTKAIQFALSILPENGGVLYFPSGHYLSEKIKGKNYMTFAGDATFSWLPDSNGSPVISPLNGDMGCLFDLDGCVGVKLVGLVLDGQKKGENMDGVFSGRSNEEQVIPFEGTFRKSLGEEQNIIIEDCKISNFSGCGVRFNLGWVWAIRKSIISSNGLDGFNITGYDGYIIDCIFALNGRMGIYGDGFTASTITASRIELNGAGGIYIGRGSGLQIANSFFCENSGPAIWIDGAKKVRAITISGNIFRRNGKNRNQKPELNSNISLFNASGVVVSGNSFHHMTLPWDDPKPYRWPRYSIFTDSLNDCVITGNAMYQGAWEELICNRGEHKNTVIENNPGRLVNLSNGSGELKTN